MIDFCPANCNYETEIILASREHPMGNEMNAKELPCIKVG